MPGFKGTYVFPSQAAAPSSPVAGQVYYNTTDGYYYGWNGTAWVYLVGIDPTDVWKQPARVATTANIANVTGAPGATIDGVTMAAGDRFLVKDQTTPAQNGIYVWASTTSAARAVDFDAGGEVDGTQVTVLQGTFNADTEWYCGAASLPVTVGTTSLYFKRAMPGHGVPARNLWSPSGTTTASIMETAPRALSNTALTLATAATHLLTGGIVIPAGRTVANMNFIYSTAAATITIYYVSLIRLSDLAVLATSANSTSAWAAAPAVKTTAFSAAYTAPFDTPAYVGIACASTTAAIIQATPASTTGFTGRVPVLCGTTTTPTTTPITGTAAAVTATASAFYGWLT